MLSDRLLKITDRLTDFNFLLGLYIFFAIVATAQPFIYGKKVYKDSGAVYTHHNNYIIFRSSFSHLKENENLYKAYPDEYWDLYKYSPTFAVLFAPLSFLPDWAGLGLWNLTNALLLFLAVKILNINDERKKALMLLMLALEMLTSIQSQQSNALMAALMIFSFVLMERQQLFWAAGMLVLSVYIKLFGLVAFALFLFYPQKPKAAAYTLFWFVLLFVLPLLFVDFKELLLQYKNWGQLLVKDHVGAPGFSVMGWLQKWFGLKANKNLVLLGGAFLYIIPLLKVKEYKSHIFRILILSSTLIWVVIFNHKAESPTFVIAMAGTVIWFYGTEKRSKFDLILFVSAMIFTSFSPTDIFPYSLRSQVFVPYLIKVVPMIVIWAKIWFEAVTYGREAEI